MQWPPLIDAFYTKLYDDTTHGYQQQKQALHELVQSSDKNEEFLDVDMEDILHSRSSMAADKQ
eukprot:3469212-Lingulodinium_polyedra.AAC.1